MPEEPNVPQPLTDEQAAAAFDAILEPKPKAKATAAEDDTKAVPEGDDNPEEEPEPEEDEEPEEEAEEPEPDDAESEVTVKIDGKNQKIKLRELANGYLRHDDYSRKTSKLGEDRKAFEAEMSETRAEREKYRGALDGLRKQMDALTPQEPDWVALLQQQGADAVFRTKLQWDQAQRNRQAVEAEYQRVAEKAEADRQAAQAKDLDEERGRMLDAIPEWKNPERMAKDRAGMVDFAKQQGLTDDDINGITDHRAVRLLRLAWIGQNMLSAKAKLKPAPEPAEVKPARPLAQTVRQSSASGMEAAKRRLAKSGSDDDAVDYFSEAERDYARKMRRGA